MFAASDGGESDVDENMGTDEAPVRYKDVKLHTASRRRSRVVLQTSCSSEEEDSPPRSRARIRAKPPPEQESAISTHRSGTVRGGKVPLVETTNRPSGTRVYVEKENNAQGHSFTGIEKALLETNQLLKHVIKRVDKCEKQIKSFESKFDEVTCSSSASIVSTPSRKKGVPEEVRVSKFRVD